MDIYTFFIQHDWVVRLMIIAFFITLIIVLEKIYHFISISIALKELEKIKNLEEIQHINNHFLQSTFIEIKSFQGEQKELFNAFIGVKLDRYEAYLMRYISILGLIAILSPMLGLIGTFMGVWHVFEGVSSISLSDPAIIAKGIKEVLIDTMAGLSMAVIAMIFYKSFEIFVHKNVINFEEKLYKILKEK